MSRRVLTFVAVVVVAALLPATGLAQTGGAVTFSAGAFDFALRVPMTERFCVTSEVTGIIAGEVAYITAQIFD